MAGSKDNRKKAGNFLSRWLHALLGKPAVPPAGQEKSNLQTTETKQSQTTPAGPDPVEQDFAALKDIAGKVSDKIEEAAEPLIEKGKEEQAKIALSSRKMVDSGAIKKMVTLTVGVILFLIVIYFAYRLFGSNSGQPGTNPGNGNEQNTPTQTPTKPTPFDYEGFLESVYTRDPEINKLEENIKVLDSEVSNLELKESSLNAPNLDFNVSF